MESVNLIRIGKAEVARNPDGIALSGGMMDVMAGLGILTREALADPNSNASKSSNDMFEKMIEATPAFFWIRSETADRSAQLAAGRAYARAQLAAAPSIQAMPCGRPLRRASSCHSSSPMARPAHTTATRTRGGGWALKSF